MSARFINTWKVMVLRWFEPDARSGSCQQKLCITIFPTVKKLRRLFLIYVTRMTYPCSGLSVVWSIFWLKISRTGIGHVMRKEPILKLGSIHCRVFLSVGAWTRQHQSFSRASISAFLMPFFRDAIDLKQESNNFTTAGSTFVRKSNQRLSEESNDGKVLT